MNLVPIPDRDGLLRLLDAAGDPVASECAAAIRDGYEAITWETEELPASHLAGLYRVRSERLQTIGLNVRGIQEAIHRFEEAHDAPIVIAIVHAQSREYPIFLRADCQAVIACLAVVVRSA